jgi:hypothetical protein
MTGSKSVLFAIAFLCIHNAADTENKVIIGLDIGINSLKLKGELPNEFGADQLEEEGFGGTYLLGYRWSNNIQMEASLSSSDNGFVSLGLHDFYQVIQARLLASYTFEISKSIRIVPLVGISRWNINLNESAFLNPGPERRSEFDGRDFSYKISMEFPINDRVFLGISFGKTNIDIGSTNLLQASVKYEF